ncbi:CwfJ C-terminus 1-domain-containing protein-like protein [Pisolithus orientalis]|uniref:CwfJ C-terminus 1-domain-containing protein-like protein n=1 Tax=Pisolithus orientalis TaxID=936130 RepID=UPI0022243254|nr:CwfJ C-terminus 1-domain-containing protein-like protein [Pisolithus orientalis]KAI6028559.1 CwfJ C-terminus 1-domain-containing protein-like protein [Pisolithus orientalis]
MTTPSSTQSIKIASNNGIILDRLAVGAALGSVRDLFAKIKSIDAKHGKFDYVLCVGDFFGPLQDASAHDGASDEGDNPLPEDVIKKYADTGGELCKDVFLLNKSALVTTIQDLRIACLGGIYNPDVYGSSEAAPGFASPFYTVHNVERLLSNTLSKSTTGQNYSSLATVRDSASSSQLVDILLTSDWPASIRSHGSTSTFSPTFNVTGSSPLDDILRKIKPRYHFAGGGADPPVFWEREPFLWEDEGDRLTRFISLGAFGSEKVTGKKERWFYAFSIAPSGPQAKRPSNVTKNPFADIAVRPYKRTFDTSEGENFIWGNVEHMGQVAKTPSHRLDINASGVGHWSTLLLTALKKQDLQRVTYAEFATSPDTLFVTVQPGTLRETLPDESPKKGSQQTSRPHGERAKRGPPKEIGPDECWFCLSNPNLAKHLIVSIGTECYLTLPKGQIIPTQSSAAGSNLSLVPGGGHVLIVPIAHHPTYTSISPDIAPPIFEETERYKSALRNLYAEYGAAAVFFEVGRLSSKGGHAHIQAVPVPRGLQDKVEEAFVSEGHAQGIDFEPDAEGALEACNGGRHSYFRVDLPDGRKMVHLMRPHAPFSVQFGRQVLVTLQNTVDRLDWKACMLTEEEDKADSILSHYIKARMHFDV